jgi:hypothetical protein
MSILAQFSTPAKIKDIEDPKQQSQLEWLWNQNVESFTQQGILGNPWTATYSANQNSYYDPLVTDVPVSSGPTSQSKAINWEAFPARIEYYVPNASQEDWWSLADTGKTTTGQPLPLITDNPCGQPPPPPSQPYGPYGPRGWQDEYCEWCVTRDPATKKITRVDFTCENPEYWRSLWSVSPETALSIYQETLDNPGIEMKDLYLLDSNNQPVNDPATGRPAYNPLNKWNCGTVRTATSGGAMHLTATPNTLQTEIGLASGASVQRTSGNNDTNALICCGQFGQMHRNSDPHIGQIDNQVVSLGLRVALTDPAGLYIQTPAFDSFQLPSNAPAGAKPSDYWIVKRGSAVLKDQNGKPIEGNFFLHCVYEVPAGLGFVVGDIMIRDNGGTLTPIQYGSQIAETIQMQINAMPVSATASPPVLPCAGSPETLLAQPLQIMYANLWSAYYAIQVPNPVGVKMSLASNSVIVPPLAEPGWTVQLALTCTYTAGPEGQLPYVAFISAGGVSTDITVSVASGGDVTYAVPGNTYPGPVQLLQLTLTIAANAELGLRSIKVVNYGQVAGTNPAAPAFLLVVAPGTLSGTGKP